MLFFVTIYWTKKNIVKYRQAEYITSSKSAAPEAEFRKHIYCSTSANIKSVLSNGQMNPDWTYLTPKILDLRVR